MGQMSGLPYPSARERASDVLRHVGLAEERYRPIGGYSTGMKQRAKLAQALVHDPRLVLLDEPTNGLDPSSRDDMLALVRRIGTEFGIAVLVTSHLLGELERISDHVVVLDSGQLLQSSATEDFMHTTGNLLVEVQGRSDADRRARPGPGRRGAARLAGRGRWSRSRCVDETTPDVVRDIVVDLGLGPGPDAGAAPPHRGRLPRRRCRQCPARLRPPTPPRLPPVSSTTSATGRTPARGWVSARSPGRSSSPGCATASASAGPAGPRSCRWGCSG